MGFFQAIAKFFGFFTREVRILIVGLDNSGKTTIVNRLQPKELQNSNVVPTIGFNIEKVKLKPLTFICFDMSGQETYRSLWEKYYAECEAVIFVLDSSDTLRLVVAEDELNQLLRHPDIRNKRIPLLFFANKIDLPNAMNAGEITRSLGLQNLRDKPWTIVSTNALIGQGIQEGIQWLSDKLQQKVQ